MTLPSLGAVVRVVLVAVLLLVVANAAIALAVPVTRTVVETTAPAEIDGVGHLRVVDDKVWRGDSPSREGYAGLAARGVTTVVDLRAEHDIRPPLEHLAQLGLTRISLPIRDGQTPTAEQVLAFQEAVRTSPGLVYLHCGAGVGRTGSVAGAYLVDNGDSAADALVRNLSVGPPSLEQIWYVASADGSLAQPPLAVTAVSRVLDAPRRLWSYVN